VGDNFISELNETNRLGELPFLEVVVVRGNPFCEQGKPYRVHMFGYMGDRFERVLIDGEGVQQREKVLFFLNSVNRASFAQLQ